MVAQLLRLKLDVIAGAFRRRPSQLVGMGIALAYSFALAVAAVLALIALREADVTIARGIVVTCGSAIVLAYLLLPLAFGADDPMEPRRFALFGIDRGQLTLGLFAAGFVGVPALTLALVAVTQVYTWGRNPVAVLIAVLGGILLLVMCVLGARVTSAIAAFALSSRAARDVTGLIVVIVFVTLAPVLLYLSTVDWSHNGFDVLARIAAFSGLTPIGAGWSAPADAAAGAFGLAWLKLLILAAFVGILWLAWRLLVARMLATPARAPEVRPVNELGWFVRIGKTPMGAIAARSLSYWARDSRYRVALGVVPFVPLLPIIALAIAGVPGATLALIPIPVMCLFLAWSTLHNDVALDDTAVWLHVAAGTRGRDDRWGRAIPVLFAGVPLVVLGSVASAAIWGDWQWFPSILGLNAVVLLGGVGLSSFTSVRFPYPTVKPGDSPYAQPQAAGFPTSSIQSLSFFGIIALALPVAGFAALGATQNTGWHWAALAAGLIVGVGVLLGGIRWSAGLFDRRAPELLEFAERN